MALAIGQLESERKQAAERAAALEARITELEAERDAARAGAGTAQQQAHALQGVWDWGRVWRVVVHGVFGGPLGLLDRSVRRLAPFCAPSTLQLAPSNLPALTHAACLSHKFVPPAAQLEAQTAELEAERESRRVDAAAAQGA